MEAAYAGGDAAFNNISATPEACEQRKTIFYNFLNEFEISETPDVENSSQSSAISGGDFQNCRLENNTIPTGPPASLQPANNVASAQYLLSLRYYFNLSIYAFCPQVAPR